MYCIQFVVKRLFPDAFRSKVDIGSLIVQLPLLCPNGSSIGAQELVGALMFWVRSVLKSRQRMAPRVSLLASEDHLLAGW